MYENFEFYNKKKKREKGGINYEKIKYLLDIKT